MEGESDEDNDDGAGGSRRDCCCGCATANTAAQDRTWAAYAACRESFPTRLQIERVDPNGRWWWRPIAHNEWAGWQQPNECMRAEITARMRRDGR
jgi:hypothetical protein